MGEESLEQAPQRKSALRQVAGSPVKKFPRLRLVAEGAEGEGNESSSSAFGGPPLGAPTGDGTGLEEDPPGKAAGFSETDLSKMMAEFAKITLNMNQQFQNVKAQLTNQAADFKIELEKLRAEVVSKPVFGQLENRVKELESGGVATSQIALLQ